MLGKRLALGKWKVISPHITSYLKGNKGREKGEKERRTGGSDRAGRRKMKGRGMAELLYPVAKTLEIEPCCYPPVFNGHA